MNPSSSHTKASLVARASRQLPIACCLLLTLFFMLPAIGCKRAKEPGTLVMAIEILPRGFDPRFSTGNTYSARIMQLVYDTLLVKNENFELIPSLADSFVEAEDHKTFTFHLRSGVRFHNDKPLTSADVKYTFESLLSPALKSPIRGALDKITAIDTPDALTVVFHAKEPFYTFAANLPAIGILPEGAGVEMASAPIGTGPYKFIAYAEGDTVTLAANPHYWGGAPNIAHLQIKIVADNSTRQAELMSGDVDIAYNSGFDPETIRALQGRSGIQVLQRDGVNVDYLGVNLSPQSQMANPKLRQAVAYALDREVIINRLLRNQATRADAILPITSWAYEPNLTKYDHDPQRAKQLLDEAGFKDPDGDGGQPRLQLKMMTTTTQISRNIAAIMQDQLRRVGIDLQLESFEFATLQDRISKGQFDMYYLRSIGANQNTDVFQFVYHSRYQNSEFNEAIAKLRSETDAAKMTPLLQTLAANLAKHLYCSNTKVEALIEQATQTSEATTKKQLYLDIARLLTDRGGQNRMRYCNPQVDEWIVEAERANDRATKLALYARIQKTIAEELPQIYLWYSANVLVASSRVGNVQLDPYGSWYFIPKLTLADQ